MELRELFNLLAAKKNLKAGELARELGMESSVASRLEGSPQWNQHWAVFLKMLDMCEEKGIDPRAPATAYELDQKEVVNLVIGSKLVKRPPDSGTSENALPQKAPEDQTPHSRPVRPSRVPRHKK